MLISNQDTITQNKTKNMKAFITKIKRSAFNFSLLLLILSGCENEMPSDPSPEINIQDYLLYSTFEGDDIGDWPDKSLPGHPVGDELQYSSRADFKVVDAGSNKAVLLAEKAPISFISRPSNFSGGAVSVRWAAKMMSHGHGYGGPNGFKRFLITTNSPVRNDTLVAIQFESGILSASTQASGLDFYNYLDDFHTALYVNSPQVEDNPDVAYFDFDCQFVVDLNYASKTFDLTIVLLDGGHAGSDPNNGPVIKVEDLPFYDATPSTSSTDPARPTLHVTDLAYWGDSPCTMDFVTIIKKPFRTFTGPVYLF